MREQLNVDVDGGGWGKVVSRCAKRGKSKEKLWEHRNTRQFLCKRWKKCLIDISLIDTIQQVNNLGYNAGKAEFICVSCHYDILVLISF